MKKETKIKSFTDLIAWQKRHELVINIYKITRKFLKEEIYSLTNQMRRAASSNYFKYSRRIWQTGVQRKNSILLHIPRITH